MQEEDDKKPLLRVPERALTHAELSRYAKSSLRLPFFRGVYTRDRLPRAPQRNETGVINLDDSRGDGTHFVAYVKRGNRVRYFDSFGLPPPSEFRNYVRGCRVDYNMSQVQDFNTENCGRLCLQFIYYECKR